MVIKFIENCTNEEKQDTCRCLSQLFNLASNLPKPCKIPEEFQRQKLRGVPIPTLIFEWLKRANSPDFHQSRSGYVTPESSGWPVTATVGKPEMPLMEKQRPGSFRQRDKPTLVAIDRYARTGSMRECRRSYVSSEEASTFQSEKTTPLSSANTSCSSSCVDIDVAAQSAALLDSELREQLSDHGDMLQAETASYPPRQKELIISHALHSKENERTHEREFYFDIKDKYEYHVYLRRHNLVWETPKQVRGEICSSVATGVVTWKENDTLYTCDLLNKQFRWTDSAGLTHFFNIISGRYYRK